MMMRAFLCNDAFPSHHVESCTRLAIAAETDKDLRPPNKTGKGKDNGFPLRSCGVAKGSGYGSVDNVRKIYVKCMLGPPSTRFPQTRHKTELVVAAFARNSQTKTPMAQAVELEATQYMRTCAVDVGTCAPDLKQGGTEWKLATLKEAFPVENVATTALCVHKRLEQEAITTDMTLDSQRLASTAWSTRHCPFSSILRTACIATERYDLTSDSASCGAAVLRLRTFRHIQHTRKQ
eukprot:4675882-Amphidinium_carterae.1